MVARPIVILSTNWVVMQRKDGLWGTNDRNSTGISIAAEQAGDESITFENTLKDEVIWSHHLFLPNKHWSLIVLTNREKFYAVVSWCQILFFVRLDFGRMDRPTIGGK
jgi:hypothetical protein